MDTGVHIGAKIDRESCEGLAQAITVIFSSARENHMDQGTVQCAVSALVDAVQTKDVTMSNCNIYADSKEVE